MMSFCVMVLIPLFLPHINAIPIDNGVVGDPEIECGPSSVTINFNTQQNFEGKVYIKEHFNDPECLALGENRAVGGIEFAFDKCGTKRERSLQPRGVFVSNTVIISFHPTFITKIDRAVRVQCFYMEADKTVSQELEVSMITTAFQTATVPMPVCRYDILDTDENGQPIKFALIGQQVYHKWTCDTQTTDTFCMVVYGCFVDDGEGDAFPLLDDNGCALDKNLLDNLEYQTDLMAGKEAHVFKYADRPNLYFNCQIRITIKEPGVPCETPVCQEPARGKRQAMRKIYPSTPAVVDVSVKEPIYIGDLNLGEQDVPRDLIHPSRRDFSTNRLSIGRRLRLGGDPNAVDRQSLDSRGVCVSQPASVVILTLGAVFLLSTFLMAVYLCFWKPAVKQAYPLE